MWTRAALPRRLRAAPAPAAGASTRAGGGVRVPAGAVEHQYMITEKTDAIPKGLPTLRDPDKIFYLKPDVGALVIGGWERNTVPFGANGIPEDFGRELLASNFERFEQVVLPAAERL